MSRILKRPMFRIGGSANDGIMSMAAPRKNYQDGNENPTSENNLMERVSTLSRFAGEGRSEKNRLLDLLLEGSLNLAGGAGAGKNIGQALALSFKEPAKSYAKGKQSEEDFQRQLRLAAVTGAMSLSDQMQLAKLKLSAEAGKDQEQRKKELMQQQSLSYTQASTHQNFLNQANTISKSTGLPVMTDPITLTFTKGKLQLANAKNQREGIYFDPKNNKYVKIRSGTAIIGDNIEEIMRPENKAVSQQSYRDFIDEELAKKRREKIEAEGYTSFDSSSP
jgi:hypothetical protein